MVGFWADYSGAVLLASKLVRYWICLLALVTACSSTGAGSTLALTNPTPARSQGPTAHWVPFVSRTGGFALKHPANWYAGETTPYKGLAQSGMGTILPPEDCGPQVYIAPCAFNDIVVSSWKTGTPVDGQIWNLPSVDSVEWVTVDGVTGVREAGPTAGCDAGRPGGQCSWPRVEYGFVSGSRIYLFEYAPLQPDAVRLTDFDMMISRTLVFSD
jgi:hypothetical protein